MNKFVLLFVLSVTTLILVVVWVLTSGNAGTESASESSPQLEARVVQGNFTDILPRPASPLQQKVIDQIHNDEYYNYGCSIDRNESDTIVLVGQYRLVNGSNTFDASKRVVTDFEQAMYQEWGPLVFKAEYITSNVAPEISTVPVSDAEVLANSYRRLYFSDVNQTMYYGWLLNYIVIAANEECLEETMKDIYHIH